MFFRNISLVLIAVVSASAAFPFLGKDTRNQKSYYASRTLPLIAFSAINEEIDEDEQASQEIRLLAIIPYPLLKLLISCSTVFSQQVDTLFFCSLFSNINTQAP